MVKRIVLLGILLSSTLSAFHSWLPKDSTTAWCSEESINGIAIPDWYNCFPNPLGVDRMTYWWRFPDSTQVNACLLYEKTSAFPNGGVLDPRVWYEYSKLWWVGPLVPRINLDLNGDCSKAAIHLGGVINLRAGDSIRLEYKMTPWDTAVADTIYGEMKAYFTGAIWTTEALRFARGKRSSASWSQGEILLSRPETGPIELLDLRGHILSTRGQIDGLGTRVIPSAPLSPGLYHLRWPGGHAGVVVPR